MNRRQAFKNLFTLAVAPVAVAASLEDKPKEPTGYSGPYKKGYGGYVTAPTFVAVGKNMLDDIPYLQSYIDKL